MIVCVVFIAIQRLSSETVASRDSLSIIMVIEAEEHFCSSRSSAIASAMSRSQLSKQLNNRNFELFLLSSHFTWTTWSASWQRIPIMYGRIWNRQPRKGCAFRLQLYTSLHFVICTRSHPSKVIDSSSDVFGFFCWTVFLNWQFIPGRCFELGDR